MRMSWSALSLVPGRFGVHGEPVANPAAQTRYGAPDMTDMTNPAGRSGDTIGSPPAGRPRRWLAVGTAVAVAVAWLLVLALTQHRSPERTAPAPPAAGEHGQVTYTAVGGQGTTRISLEVDPAGGAVLDSLDDDPSSDQPAERKHIRITLTARARAELVDAVQGASRARLRDSYAVEGVSRGWDQTVSFGGRTIQLLASDSGAPEPLRRLIDVLARITTFRGDT